MNCTNCGQVLPAGATACPNCGTAVAAAPPAAGPATGVPPAGAAGVPGHAGPARTGSSVPSYHFDTANLTTADWVTGFASLVLLISLFLEWYTVNLPIVGSEGISGVSGHGWLYLVFLLCLVVIAYEVMKAGWGRMPFNVPLNEERILLIITVINLVLVVIAFVFKAGTGAAIGVDIKIGWGFGAFVGLIAAVVAALPHIVPAIQGRSRK